MDQQKLKYDQSAKEFLELVFDNMSLKGSDELFKPLFDSFDLITQAEVITHYDYDSLMSEISRMFVGRAWPLYGDSEEYTQKFYKDFFAAAEELGYEPTVDAALLMES